MSILDATFSLGKELILVYLGIAIGYFFKKSQMYRERVEEGVVNFVIYFAFPFLILKAMLSISEGQERLLFSIILLASIIVLVNWMIQTIYLANFSKDGLSSDTKGAEIVCASFPNSLNLPFPIILAILGDTGLIAGTMFVISIMTLQNTLGIYVSIKYGKGDHQSAISTILSTFKFPLTWAIIIGFVLRLTIGQYEFTSTYVDLTQTILIFITLIVVGFNLIIPSPSKLFESASIKRVAILRFIVAPIIGVSLFVLFSYESDVIVPLFIQVMAPPAINNAIYAKHFGLDVTLTSQLIAILTFIYLVFLPIQLGLIYILWV